MLVYWSKMVQMEWTSNINENGFNKFGGNFKQFDGFVKGV